ncbi:hypothetical protein E2C01_021096 [Portunus trituberculatus]|uniref:Uncharacterized protein n=1 Tax=Portunus trituberculatus TaxID=210409 RepID=A0A5B7E3I7_PORTR|nr:hypothetical protein [Portunus trituberculatus]
MWQDTQTQARVCKKVTSCGMTLRHDQECVGESLHAVGHSDTTKSLHNEYGSHIASGTSMVTVLCLSQAISLSVHLSNPERGWNDPPKLAFCPARTGNASGPGRHRLLNKRVPIPVNPQTSSAPSPMPPSLK